MDDMTTAYRLAAVAVRRRLAEQRPDDLALLGRVRKKDVAVLEGTYDHVHKILDLLEVPYRKDPRTTGRDTVVLYVNCASSYKPTLPILLEAYVRNGGWLVSSDWALGHLLQQAFPETVAWNREESQEEVVSVEPRLDGLWSDVVVLGANPQWWLEYHSHPIEILDRERVRVEAASHELWVSYNAPEVAVSFDWGRGHVFHVVSHFWNARTRDLTARHEGPCVNFLAQGLRLSPEGIGDVLSQARLKPDAVSFGALQSAATATELVVQLCVRAKRAREAARVSRARKLVSKLAAEEERFRESLFLAPCVRGGRVRVRLAGLVQTFAPRPADFEGWGIFLARDLERAELVEEAGLPEVARYLKLLRPLKVRLATKLAGLAWLAFPANTSDARQRGFAAEPLALQLVDDGAAFEQVVARSDGASWWFDQLDRREDPRTGERLREALRAATPPESLGGGGLTPEMRISYELATQRAAALRDLAALRAAACREQAAQHRDERRLEQALRTGGGRLRDFRDRGEHWLVEWTTPDGTRHSSAITKRDLTVVSAGICLEGRDRDFDLQSLVGVIEAAGDGAYYEY